MASPASELRLRTISALVLAAVAFAEVWAGGWLFSLFVSALAFIVFLEWTAIIGLTAFDSARLRAGFSILLLLSILVVFGPEVAISGLVLFVAFA